MQVKITYPEPRRGGFRRSTMLRVLRWPFLAAAVLCPVINIWVGGKAWSLVALMALYMAWTLLFAIDLVEYNRISQVSRLVVCSCALLSIIELFIASGWALFVVPLVGFGGTALVAVLFFTDFERQKQNLLPLLMLLFEGLFACIIGRMVKGGSCGWPLDVLGAFSFALLVVLAVVLRGEFLREIRRRFHVK